MRRQKRSSSALASAGGRRCHIQPGDSCRIGGGHRPPAGALRAITSGVPSSRGPHPGILGPHRPREHELERGHLARARALLEEALATAREFRFGLIEAEALRGWRRSLGNTARPDQAATISMKPKRSTGNSDAVYLADALNSFGYLALRKETTNEPAACSKRPWIWPGFRGLAAIARFLHSLGDAPGKWRLQGAAVRYREGLVLAQETENTTVATGCLTGLAGLAAEIGRHEEAARLFGAGDTAGNRGNPGICAMKRSGRTEDMAAVREALGSEADAEARAAGQALPLETAVSEALALADELARQSATGAGRSRDFQRSRTWRPPAAATRDPDDSSSNCYVMGGTTRGYLLTGIPPHPELSAGSIPLTAS